MGASDYYKNSWLNNAKLLKENDNLDMDQKKSLENMIESPDEENMQLAKAVIRLKIADALVEGLNNGQKAAFIKMVEFFNSDTYDAAVLKGYAGTGKTFLVKRFIEYITRAYPFRRIAVTAPTNKAVSVLSKTSPFADNSAVFESEDNDNSKIVFSTIHKLLGLSEKIDQYGNQSFVAGKKKAKISKFQYLIVDEVSMLNDTIFDELMLFKDSVKLIFMGDPAQIPPIGKEHCKPFKEEDQDINFVKTELTEIMRQKGSHPIVDYSMLLRENLDKPQPIANLKSSINNFGKGVVVFNRQTERAKVKNLINLLYNSPMYAKNSNYIKIIAWKNKTVEYLNNLVRKELYGDKLKRFNVGDVLIANKALFEESNAGRGKYIIKASTSDEFVIDQMSKQKINNKLSIPGGIKINFTATYHVLNCIKTQNGIKSKIEIRVIAEESVKDFQKQLNKVKNLAKQSKNRQNWIAYYDMLKWSDDVAYAYAITAHKSQGSTYENALVIEEDINHNKKTIERNRIKYTAYTRASNRLYIL